MRITLECCNELFVLENDNITKQITNMRDISTAKLNLATKIFHVYSFVALFSSFFLICDSLKLDVFYHLMN